MAVAKMPLVTPLQMMIISIMMIVLMFVIVVMEGVGEGGNCRNSSGKSGDVVDVDADDD